MSLAQILLHNNVKGGMMKKVLVYLLIVLMFGAVFGIALSRNNTVQEDLPVVSTVLETFVIPATAYAQDTGNIEIPPPSIPRDP
jgi:hypothetical protein